MTRPVPQNKITLNYGNIKLLFYYSGKLTHQCFVFKFHLKLQLKLIIRKKTFLLPSGILWTGHSAIALNEVGTGNIRNQHAEESPDKVGPDSRSHHRIHIGSENHRISYKAMYIFAT